jgi:5-methylcytosine-specific restriction protein A
VRAQSDAQRGSSAERGYGWRWRQASAAYLKANPMCVCANCAGVRLPATVVDHKIPHRIKDARDSGDRGKEAVALKLLWDQGNWQALAKVCHDIKTASQDGGFRHQNYELKRLGGVVKK